jgi:D-alanyl-D-alanine carboxypeptidase/D-alanyl-D-alanine-endopeptidase (penicillin-binding protein 4)
VRGKLPVRSARYTAECAHTDPVELFGQAFAARLRAAGIELGGSVRRARHAPAGTRLAELVTPLVAYLVPINTESVNAVTDQLFLALGQELEGAGTAAGGARATARALAQLGVDTTGFVQRDGSGLSRENRVTARQLTELLAAVLELDARTAGLYRDSLAVAGETGTLGKRMRDSPAAGRVRAKTGFIAGVSSLSGVVQSNDDRELVFSCIVSYPPVDGLNTKCWKPMQDELCDLLVGPAP